MKLWGQTNQKRWKKIVAEVMCLIMLIQMIPTPVHAEEWEEYAVSEEVQAVSADALAEDISLRTKDTKRFRMEDGSYTVVQYDGAVHYKDDEGNWENIDNRLQPFAMGDSMAIQGVEILEGYRNQENSISVYFASSLENGTIYEYGDDKYQVELSLFTDPIFSEIVIPENDSANGGTMESSSVNSVEENVESNSMIDQIQDNKIYSQARAKVLDTTEMTNAQFETKLEELYTLNNVKSSIIYEDVYDNVDLYYEVYGTSVKEKIIVKEPSDAYTYTFELQLNGLLPRLEKDGSISLYDPDLGEGTNAIQYQIPTPYMKDSSGIGGSPNVYYELGDMTEDGRVTLAIVADPQWINDEVREWPIMIDPAIIEYNENYTWDTYVIEGYPEAQNYASDSLYAGWSSYDNYGRMRIFWEYEPLPEIPPASVVVNCQILLRQFYDGYSYFAGSETMDLAVREITEDWNLDNVINWYRQPVYSNEIIDYKTVSTETMATRVGLDITSLAQEWYGGTKENNGVAIFPVTEYSTATASYTSCNASFASCNYGDMLPIFMVQYRDTKGIESYWTYHTQNVGEAGTGYINDFTGNLTFVHEDMDSVGNVMPIHGEHIYNGYLAGKNYTEDNTLTADFSAMKIGAGWKLGFQETMVTTTIGGISYYVHCDRDGTEHFYFNQDDDSEYESEDGLKYTVSKNANGTYTMKDESGGIKEFDADGRMTRMQDVNGNQKNFIYSNGQLTSVQEKTADGNAKTIMSYSYVNQYLSQMKDGLDQADTITYYYSTTPTGTLYSGSGLSNLGNTAYLRKIVHSKGNTTIFEYDENGFLTEVQDQNTMYKMTYEYNMVGSIPGKVIKTKEYGYDFENESALEGQSMGASYSGHKTTQFRTSGKDDIFGNNDDVIDTYVMDHFGRTVCQYTTLTGSQTIYAASNTMYSDGEDSFKTKHAVTQSAVGGGWASSGNVSSNNLLGNGDFANSSSWSLSNGASVTGGTLQVIGNHKGVRSSSQSITVNASGSQTYILSGWGKATAVAQNGEEGPQRFELRAVLTYTDGTNETQTVRFNTDVTEWQYISGGIVPKSPAKTVQKITIYCAYDYQPNTAYFDKIRLVQEPSPTYRYDDDGNMISITNDDGSQQALVYSGVDLTKETLPNGEQYTYTYKKDNTGASTHQIETISDQNGVEATYGYDAFGNITQVLIEASGMSQTVSGSATYTDSGRYLSSLTDALGNTRQYQSNTSTGLLTYTQDPDGNRTSYTYDARETLTNVWEDQDKDGVMDTNETGVVYEYDHNMLDAIRTRSTSYHYQYDPYWGLESVGVGSGTGETSYLLRQYAYNNYGGKIASLTYGNGDVVRYSYDALDRLQTLSYNDQVKYQYTYNDDNQLSKIQDQLNQITMNLVYDRIGRLNSMSIAYPAKGNIAAANLNIQYSYDSIGRLKGQSYAIADTTHTYAAAYKNNSDLIQTFTIPNASIQYSYDGMQRVTDQKIQKGSTVLGGQSYAYQAGNAANKTSTMIHQVTMDVTGNQYQYEYDENGNIIQIKKNGTVIASYTYDHKNQLLTEQSGGQTKTYTYDLAGNIQTITESVGAESQTVASYGYSTSWGDLMTQYNGHTLTYDQGGNPLQYYNGKDYTLTWKEGRFLGSAAVDGVQTTYQYTEGGARVSKTVGGKTTVFYLDHSKIIRENRNGVLIDYFYDDQGEVVGFQYNNKTYYFGKNLQGDIIELYENGQLLAEYTYDAWGVIKSISDSQGNEITEMAHAAIVNPFRYRGYYYDEETGFYYLNSRYYDPITKRFISADSPDLAQVSPTSASYNKNLFSYCDNNPVTRKDSEGEIWFQVWGTLIGGVLGGVSQMVTNLVNGDDIMDGVIGAAVGGAVAGLALTTTFNPTASSFISAAAEEITNQVESYVNGEQKLSVSNAMQSVVEVAASTATGGLTGLVTGGVAGSIPGLKINPGWFKPTKILPSLTGKYARKAWGQMAVDTALAATADVLEEKSSMMPQPSYGSRTVSKGYPTSSTNRSTGKFYRVCL